MPALSGKTRCGADWRLDRIEPQAAHFPVQATVTHDDGYTRTSRFRRDGRFRDDGRDHPLDLLDFTMPALPRS